MHHNIMMSFRQKARYNGKKRCEHWTIGHWTNELGLKPSICCGRWNKLICQFEILSHHPLPRNLANRRGIFNDIIIAPFHADFYVFLGLCKDQACPLFVICLSIFFHLPLLLVPVKFSDECVRANEWKAYPINCLFYVQMGQLLQKLCCELTHWKPFPRKRC